MIHKVSIHDEPVHEAVQGRVALHQLPDVGHVEEWQGPDPQPRNFKVWDAARQASNMYSKIWSMGPVLITLSSQCMTAWGFSSGCS